ncbi:ATP-dependent DNA helicase RecG [Candidatus Omnitrophota bacterium]
MEKSLSTPIRYLKGMGPRKAKLFNRLGISTIEDLLYHFPRRYEDRSHLLKISELKEGEEQTIEARVLAVRQRQAWRRRRFNIFEAQVKDATGKIYCVWFNQPYIKEYFKPGRTCLLHGRVQRYKGRLQMTSPEFEFADEEAEESTSVGRITPVYSLPEGITQRNFRKFIKSVLQQYLSQIHDFLSFDIRSRNKLLNLARSLLNIHFPESQELQKSSYSRLSFDEFFLFQVPLALRKLKKKEKRGISHKAEGELVEGLIASLPFELTPSQEKVIGEIKADLSVPQPMQRLLQGDVGSGKTVVALIASLAAIQGGYQSAFMVPTEILARQHYENFKSQTSSLGKSVNIGLVTGSLKKNDKENICRQIKTGRINLIIGTHALLEEDVEFKNLGLTVIDEQHKFGVGQRALLPRKGLNPDVLIMTATPIPRTLAITLYGDLDISVIDELPPGRLPIKAIHYSEEKVSGAYETAKQELLKGRQVYIVYPVIEDSYALDMAGAKKMYEELRQGEFREFRLGLIHGKLKQSEQDRIMARFKNRELDMLVTTTVLEVGIDVSNATCMIIEHAGRFGLAQLHQLRGRVGRGSEQSFCLLIANPVTQESRQRIEAMVKYNDGFHIAEEDLKIRGPGEFFGRRQHGLAELKIANPLTQLQLLRRARQEAIRLVNGDPGLQMRQNRPLKEKVLERFPGYDKLMVVG